MASKSKGGARQSSARAAVGVKANAAAAARSHKLAIAALLTGSSLVYLRALGNHFVYDDNEEISLNHLIGDWSFAWRSFAHDSWWFRDPTRLPQSAYYRPLQDLWLALNYHTFGMNPLGWHLAMIAIEVLAVYLLFKVAGELTHDFTSALIAAALFAILPIHVQAVVWPSAIVMPMAAVFDLGALLIVIRHGAWTPAWLVAALILSALAMLSHESAIMFPAIVASYLLIEPGKESAERSWTVRIRASAIGSAGFFAVAAVYLALRYSILGFISRANPTNHMSVAEIALTMPEAVGQYVLLLLAPWRAEPAHPVVQVSSVAAPEFYGPLLGLLAIASASAMLLAHRKRAPLYLFCGAWIALAIAPVLNLGALSPIAMVEDRYLYFPSAAWCVMLGALAGELLLSAETVRNVVIAALVTAALGLIAVLWHVQGYWHDDAALFGRCVEVFPGSSLCHERLGMALKGEGEFTQAAQEFQIAGALDPDSGSALYNLAIVQLMEGNRKLAVDEMVRALPRIKDAPAEAYGEAARIAIEDGDDATADRLLHEAARHTDGAEVDAIGRAEMKIAHHDYAAAEAILHDAVVKYPANPDVWILLAVAEQSLGNTERALAAAEQAVARGPNVAMAHIERAKLLDQIGRHRDAVEDYRRALEIEPNDPGIRKTAAEAAPEAMR
jgi:protein O-mannosyl-transferase